jgi:4-carboxymuconolactone decarboxylase
MRDGRGCPVSRIPLVTSRDGLDAEAQAVFDRLVASRGSLLRPFEVLLHAPALADAVGELGHVVRARSGLRDADREVITLATGLALGCAFVWDSHLESARAAGVDPATIEALEHGGVGLGDREATLVAFVRELCGTSAVSEDTFRAAHDVLGTTGVVETALTVGYYTMLVYTMSAVDAC